MRKVFVTAAAWSVILGTLGCGMGNAGAPEAGATAPSLEAHASAQPGAAGQQLSQYRAVCIETSAHNGKEYVLTRWLDNREKAQEYGDYHGNFKAAGHHWKIEQRAKPERATP